MRRWYGAKISRARAAHPQARDRDCPECRCARCESGSSRRAERPIAIDDQARIASARSERRRGSSRAARQRRARRCPRRCGVEITLRDAERAERARNALAGVIADQHERRRAVFMLDAERRWLVVGEQSTGSGIRCGRIIASMHDRIERHSARRGNAARREGNDDVARMPSSLAAAIGAAPNGAHPARAHCRPAQTLRPARQSA